VRFAAVKAGGYAKLYQKASHYAIVGVAAALEVKGGTIQSSRLGLTGATTHAVRLTDVERALAGVSAAGIEQAVRGAGADLQAINSDIHASEEYRRAMIPVFTRRALHAALGRV
jgi:carbon-monoxide dehydrogenase medium subunit